MELTPLVPSGRQVIERYGASGFRVSGTLYRGPILVFPDRTIEWAAAAITPETITPAAITPEALAPVVAHGGVELLLIGLGRRMAPVAAALRASLRASGIAVEAMDTGAACRTYNVLVAEDRRVAAALLPPT